MCSSSKPKPSPPTPPVPPPAPAQEAPQAPVIGGDEKGTGKDRQAVSSRKKGRNALRIDLAAGSALEGAPGLHIAR